MNMRASELKNIFAFSHSKTAISFNILLVLILCLRKIYFQVSNYICINYYTINAVSFYYLWYDTMFKRQYTDKTLTLWKSMYMRASGGSELRKFWHFYIIKVLFLSIFCWYFRYFVGTNDMLVGLHVPTKLRKSIIGGGGGAISPYPPLAPLVGMGRNNHLQIKICKFVKHISISI